MSATEHDLITEQRVKAANTLVLAVADLIEGQEFQVVIAALGTLLGATAARLPASQQLKATGSINSAVWRTLKAHEAHRVADECIANSKARTQA